MVAGVRLGLIPHKNQAEIPSGEVQALAQHQDRRSREREFGLISVASSAQAKGWRAAVAWALMRGESYVHAKERHTVMA